MCARRDAGRQALLLACLHPEVSAASPPVGPRVRATRARLSSLPRVHTLVPARLGCRRRAIPESVRSQVGAIRGSTQREPTVVGKPEGFMLKNIAEKFGLKASQICMVGDRLDTDIMFGKNGGLKTALVLSGVTTEAELLSDSNTVHPDAYMDKLPDLLTVKERL